MYIKITNFIMFQVSTVHHYYQLLLLTN